MGRSFRARSRAKAPFRSEFKVESFTSGPWPGTPQKLPFPFLKSPARDFLVLDVAQLYTSSLSPNGVEGPPRHSRPQPERLPGTTALILGAMIGVKRWDKAHEQTYQLVYPYQTRLWPALSCGSILFRSMHEG